MPITLHFTRFCEDSLEIATFICLRWIFSLILTSCDGSRYCGRRCRGYIAASKNIRRSGPVTSDSCPERRTLRIVHAT